MRTHISMQYWVIFGTFSLGLIAVLNGFGGDDLSRVSVAGTVYLDGKPMESGTIRFFSKNGFGELHVGVSLVENGKYAITDTGSLVPGLYEVQVRSYAQEPVPTQIKKDADRIPPSQWLRVATRYNDESVLEVKIDKDGLSRFDFNLNN